MTPIWDLVFQRHRCILHKKVEHDDRMGQRKKVLSHRTYSSKSHNGQDFEAKDQPWSYFTNAEKDISILVVLPQQGNEMADIHI